MLIHSSKNVHTVQLLGETIVGDLNALKLEEHAEEQGVRAEHERWVVDNLQDFKLITRDLLSSKRKEDR